MLNTRVDLQAIEETITRPVLVIVTNDIKNLLGITRDIYTTYDVNDALIKSKNKLGEVKGENTFKEDMISIEYTENSEDGNDLSLVVYRPDFKPIYLDKELRAKFTPIYHSRKISIKFKYMTKSKSNAFALANKIRLFTSTDAMYKVHNLEYHYTVPNFLTNLLIHINNLKNTRIIDSEKLILEDYIATTFDNRVDFSHTLDANSDKSTLVIREAQLGIEGYIADDIANIQPEYDDSFTTWNLEFNYDFIYEKPVTILATYPLLVYNRLIDKQFRTFINPNTRAVDNVRAHRTGRRYGIDPITSTNSPFKINDENYYLTIPKIDQEVLPKPSAGLTRLFSILCILDDKDPTLLFNLNDIPEVEIKENMLDFITSEKNYFTEPMSSLFHIELYKNDKKDYSNKVILEGDGTLRSTYPLDYRYTYRVVVNIYRDLTLLNINARKRLKNFIIGELGSDELSDKKVFFNNMYNDITVSDSTKDIVTSYITLLGAKPENVYDVMHKTNKYSDLMFNLTADPNFRRTVQINLTSILREKNK